MIIKVLVLSDDEEYSVRFKKAIENKYSDNFRVFFLNNVEHLHKQIILFHPDLLVLDEKFADVEIDDAIHVGIACFVENNNFEKLNDRMAIFKYQELSKIVTCLFELFSEYQKGIAASVKNSVGTKQKIITFMSPAGGCGTSTMAASCAQHLAEKGEKVLYVNFNPFDSVDDFFQADGEFGLSRVLYSLEMDNDSTIIKIESSIRQDHHGVYFFSNPDSSMDLISISDQIYDRFFEVMKKIPYIEWIIVDTSCLMDSNMIKQMNRSYATIIVSDGKKSSLNKVIKFSSALQDIEAQELSVPWERICIVYNYFRTLENMKIEMSPFKEIGTMSYIANASVSEIVNYISGSAVFDYLTKV